MSELRPESCPDASSPSAPGRVVLPHAPQTLPPPPHFEPLPPRAAASAAGQASLRPAYEVPHMAWPWKAQQLAAEAWRQIEQLAQSYLQGRAGRGAVWLLTGTRRGEGRTTLALALACHLSRCGRPVVLVDIDAAHPQLAEQLGIEPAAACDDVLAGRLPLEEALIESACEPAVLLPLRAGVSATLIQAGQVRLVGMIRRLAHAYGTVLLDAGPVLRSEALGDTLLSGLAGVIDAALVVLDVRHATHAEAQAAGRRLALAGVSSWHIAENYVPSRAA